MESLVIFTAVDGVVGTSEGDASAATAQRVIDSLCDLEVPIIFVTERPAAEMLRFQEQLAIRHPFIAGGGAALYVPTDYFPGLLETATDAEPGWKVLEVAARSGDPGDAVRFLMALYRFNGDSMLFVGLGEDWKHRALLRAVDVSVVVRNDGIDQVRLLRSIPEAYLTAAAGADGWAEAILGGGRLD